MFAQVSWDETKKMYDELIDVNYLKRPKLLRLLNSEELNAWADDKGGVNLTTQDLKKLSKEELAFVLGHELAHIQFDDTKGYLGGTYQEDRADHYGSFWAENLGYSKCKQANFFLRLYKLNGNQGGNGDPHSKNLTRFWRLYKYCR